MTDAAGQRVAVALHAVGFDVTLIAGPGSPDVDTLAGLPCIRLAAGPGLAYRTLARATNVLRRLPPAGLAHLAHAIDHLRPPPSTDAQTAVTTHLARTRPDLVAWSGPGRVALKAGDDSASLPTADADPATLAQVVTAAVRALLPPTVTDRLRPRDAAAHLRAVAAEELHARPRLAATQPPVPRPWLRIGNANSAGLPRHWGDALMRHHPGVLVETTWLERDQATRFGTDEVVRHWQWTDPRWQNELVTHLQRHVTHVLTESGRPVVGTRFGKDFATETGFFATAGIALGLVFHGSDIRDPARHRELEPFSPFHDRDHPLVSTLQARTSHLAGLVREFPGPKFVTTCDLFDYVPDARWLPLTIDRAEWDDTPAPFPRGRMPVVLHAPTSAFLKGSDAVDNACSRLAAAGRITYLRLTTASRAEFVEHVRAADIVVDQLRLGDYGMTAVEAMAAGRVVIAHVADRVRARLPERVPVAQATPPEFETVLKGLLDDIPGSTELALSGREYARQWHDGTRAAAVLAEFVGAEEVA